MYKLSPAPRHEIDASTYLEPVTINDLGQINHIVQTCDPDLKKFMGWPKRFSLGDAIKMCQYMDEAAEKGTGAAYKIIHEGEYSGHTGISLDGEGQMPGLFFWLVESKRGIGLATRSAKVVRDEAFESGVEAIAIKILPRNVRSQRVADRLGAVHQVNRASHVKRMLPTMSPRLLLPETWVVTEESYGR